MKQICLTIIVAAALTLAGCGRSTNEEASEGVAIPTAAPRMTPGSALESGAGGGAVAAQPTPTAAEAEAAEGETEDAEAAAEAEAETEPTATAEPTATTAPPPAAESADAEPAADEAAAETASDETTAITETVDLTETVSLTETDTVTETAPITEEMTSTVETAEDAESTAEVSNSAAVTETAAVDASTAISATESVTETTGAESGAGAAETLAIEMNDLYFGEKMDNIVNPPVWNVTSGAEVALDLENMGSVDHNWALVKADTEVPVPFDAAQNSELLLFDPGVVAAGESKTVTFTAPVPGVYTVICTVPGHYPVMQGRLEVK
ncbi:MAG: plastocyanin/azurin family copper-binding protein [Caldilineaceae bacterium]